MNSKPNLYVWKKSDFPLKKINSSVLIVFELFILIMAGILSKIIMALPLNPNISKRIIAGFCRIRGILPFIDIKLLWTSASLLLKFIAIFSTRFIMQLLLLSSTTIGWVSIGSSSFSSLRRVIEKNGFVCTLVTVTTSSRLIVWRRDIFKLYWFLDIGKLGIWVLVHHHGNLVLSFPFSFHERLFIIFIFLAIARFTAAGAVLARLIFFWDKWRVFLAFFVELWFGVCAAIALERSCWIGLRKLILFLWVFGWIALEVANLGSFWIEEASSLWIQFLWFTRVCLVIQQLNILWLYW